MTLTFLGAARTVTGSKHLLEVEGRRLLVDSGLFQGLKDLRERNWQPLPIRADSIEAVILTHAHLDHCGFLPRLVAQGFKGRIWCTAATEDLARIVLEDAAKLQEEDAERANRKGYTKHHPALPLFTMKDAARAMALLQPVGYERPMPVSPGVTVEFVSAGHLLGSAYARVRIESTGKTILFGGDLGRYSRPVLPDPAPPGQADVLLVESTYGDRVHAPDDDGAAMADVVNDTVKRGGKLIIPAFALGRVEELLYWIQRLEEQRRIPELPVYVDSPMAAKVLEQYRTRLEELDPDVAVRASRDGGRRAAERKLCSFCTAKLTVVTAIAESRAVQESLSPRSSSRRAAWRPAVAFCTISRVRCPIGRTPYCSWATRRPARGAARSKTAPDSRESTARRSRYRPGSWPSTRCRRTPIRTRSCGGCAAFRHRRRSRAWSTVNLGRWTR